MQVGELFVALGFSVDNAKLKEFNDKIGAGTKAIGAMAAGAAAAVYGVNRFISSAVSQAVQLQNLNKILGASREEIKRLEVAGREFNSSFTFEDAASTWTKLWEIIQDAKDGKYPEELLRLGIGNIRDDNPMSLLMKIRESRNGFYDDQKWVDFVKKLGLEQSIPMLGASDSALDRAFNIPVPSEEDIESWERVAKAINDFSIVYQNAKMASGKELSPTLIEFFENSAAAVSWLGDALGSVVKWFRDAGKESNRLTTYLGFVAAAILAIFNPLLWIPIGIAGLLAAWDLLGSTIRGSSWLSDWWKGLKAIPDAIKESIDWFGRLLDKVKEFGDNLKDSLFLKFLNLFITEEGSKFADLKKKLEEKGVGQAKDIIQRGGMAMPREQWYDPRGYPPQPYPITPMEQSNTFNTNINTTANPRDMADAWSLLHEAYVRNISLDMLMGASGLQTSSGNAPASVLRQ